MGSSIERDVYKQLTGNFTGSGPSEVSASDLAEQRLAHHIPEGITEWHRKVRFTQPRLYAGLAL